MRWMLVVVLATACPTRDSDTDDPAGETDTETDEPRETGVEVFLRRCSSCHGADATGTSAGYELRHPPRAYAAWVIRAGRPGLEFPTSNMPGWSDRQLDETQLEEMFDWLDAFERPTDGQDLFQDLCANCHGEYASGGAVSSDVRGLGTAAINDAVRTGRGGEDYGVRRAYMPAWSVEEISDAELEAIGGWLEGLGG